MGIDAQQLKDYVIVPTLNRIGLCSPTAIILALGTCAQESQGGKYLKQIKGSALGIYQMEPLTHQDIWDNFLKYNDVLAQKVLAIDSFNYTHLVINLSYATAMMRLHYRRVKEPLPDENDIQGIAEYYKKYYNTPQGKATPQQFIDNYNAYIAGRL